MWDIPLFDREFDFREQEIITQILEKKWHYNLLPYFLHLNYIFSDEDTQATLGYLHILLNILQTITRKNIRVSQECLHNHKYIQKPKIRQK